MDIYERIKLSTIIIKANKNDNISRKLFTECSTLFINPNNSKESIDIEQEEKSYVKKYLYN